MAKTKTPAGKLLESFNRLQGRKNESAEPELGPDGKPLPAKDEGADDEIEGGEGSNGEAEVGDGAAALATKVEDGTANDLGEVPNAAMASIKEKDWAEDDDKKMKAMEGLKKLSESKHPMAKKFMEALDDVCASADVKKMDKDGKEVNEDADGEYMVSFQPEKWANLDKGVANFGEGKKK